MHQVLLFENLDPWQMDLRRDSRGRFAGGGGGGGGGGGRSKVGGGRTFKAGGRYRTQTTKVSGMVKGKRRTATVSSTQKTLRGGGKAYVYKVKKGGIVDRNPGKFATNRVTSKFTKSPFRPGTPVGSKNVRYVSKAHAATRTISLPGSRGRLLGRGISKVNVMRARAGKPLAAGYVVSYGKPLSGKRP